MESLKISSYSLMKLTSKEVMVTSNDPYYHKDYTEETVQTLEFIESFDEESGAIEQIEIYKETVEQDSSSKKYLGGDYVILPIYSI